jgi:hypothetical protein
MGGMATYLVLIYGDEQAWAAMTAEEQRKLAEGHRALVAAAGTAVLDTRELEPASGAITLRADTDGRVAATEGPFLQAREAVGGYYLIEAADLDEVRGLASRLYEASAGHGGVEIRAVSGHG